MCHSELPSSDRTIWQGTHRNITSQQKVQAQAVWNAPELWSCLSWEPWTRTWTCAPVWVIKKCRLSHEFPKFEPWLKKLDMPTAKHGAMIRKQAHVHECGGRIKENYWWLWNSKKQDVLWPPDQVGHALWPPPDQTVQQDSFAMSKISPLLTLINQLNDLEGLWVFYYLIQNLRI